MFVTGYSNWPQPGPTTDYAMLAYDAATGARRWPRLFSGRATGDVVGPDSSKVFVTGSSATLAYDAATGTRVWTAR